MSGRGWLFLGASAVSLGVALGAWGDSALPEVLRFAGHLLGALS